MMTPSASLKQHNLTLKDGAPIVLRFKQPVRTFSYGPDAQHLTRRVLHKPLDRIRLPRPAAAGTLTVAAAPRAWETSPPAIISWFPAGIKAGAVASPAPGSTITPHTDITLTFSKPIDKALGSSRPPVSPSTPGVLAPAQQPRDGVQARELRLRSRRQGPGRPAERSSARRRPADRNVKRRHLDRARRVNDSAAAAALPARLPAVRRQGRARRAHAGGPGDRGGQATEGDLRLEVPEHPGRAAQHVGARDRSARSPRARS